MREYLPRRGTQAAAVETVDKWFDVFNSRAPYASKPTKSAYGVTPSCQAAQDAALSACEELLKKARKCTGGTLRTRKAMLPFQAGVLRCITSLRGLADDLRSSVEGFSFIMTARLNQDCVENLFSQIRSMGGANQMPDAAEFRARLRMLLMAPAPLVAASSRGCAVQLEDDPEFLTTGQLQCDDSTRCISNEALEGVNIPVSMVERLFICFRCNYTAKFIFLPFFWSLHVDRFAHTRFLFVLF